MHTFTTLGVIGATMLGVFTAQQAAAESFAAMGIRYVRTAAVQVADLDLTRVPDVEILYERIRYAARSICAADALSFDTKKAVHQRQCVTAAVEDAVDRTNEPLLTAVHLRQRARLARL